MKRPSASERVQIVRAWLSARRRPLDPMVLEYIKRRGLRKSAHYAKYKKKESHET